MKKCYATIHVWLHDMDHNIDLNYRRKIRPQTLYKVNVERATFSFFINFPQAMFTPNA